MRGDARHPSASQKKTDAFWLGIFTHHAANDWGLARVGRRQAGGYPTDTNSPYPSIKNPSDNHVVTSVDLLFCN
jgi:hypothetical protein